jgi:hypothetical protein
LKSRDGQSFLIVAVNMASKLGEQTLLLKYKKVQITIFPSCRNIEIKTIKDFPHKTAKQIAYEEAYVAE